MNLCFEIKIFLNLEILFYITIFALANHTKDHSVEIHSRLDDIGAFFCKKFKLKTLIFLINFNFEINLPTY